MRKDDLLDALVIIGFLTLAPTISFIFKTSLVTSIFLFYGLPGIYLSFKIPYCIKRAVIFSFIGTILFFVIDYIAVLDGAWWVSTIFSFRLLGVLPIEDTIWFFAGSYLVVMFYEYFDDKATYVYKKTRIKYLVEIVSLIVAVFILSLLFYPQILLVHYAYFWIGLVFFVVPTTIILLKYPKLRFKFLRTNLYMFALQLPFEIIALKIGQWSFPGKNFISWVQLAGVRFPFEEFFIYISMTGIAMTSYYEFFDDDRK